MEGRRYCDPLVLGGQAEYLPDNLRNKVGLPPSQMIGVYEEFARNIPGFQQLDRESVSMFIPKSVIILNYFICVCYCIEIYTYCYTRDSLLMK